MTTRRDVLTGLLALPIAAATRGTYAEQQYRDQAALAAWKKADHVRQLAAALRYHFNITYTG